MSSFCIRRSLRRLIHALCGPEHKVTFESWQYFCFLSKWEDFFVNILSKSCVYSPTRDDNSTCRNRRHSNLPPHPPACLSPGQTFPPGEASLSLPIAGLLPPRLCETLPGDLRRCCVLMRFVVIQMWDRKHTQLDRSGGLGPSCRIASASVCSSL